MPSIARAARLIVAAALLVTGPAAWGVEQSYERLDPNAYQSFVVNWIPAAGPLCAVIRTPADWDRVLKPAATMGRTLPFAPPTAFWKIKAVLLVAHVVGAGDTSNVFAVTHLARSKGALAFDERFTPTPAASSTMKWYVAVAVVKPLPPVVRFEENGKLICTLRTRAVAPVTPPIP